MNNLNQIPKHLLTFLLACYKYLISPFLPMGCRFHPTCSEYAKLAINEYGVIVGVYLMVKRLLRCHPFASGGYDPVPKRKK